MVPLPIVERELRAASRRKSTHRIRIYTTLVAVVISVAFFPFYLLASGTFTRVGPFLFYVLGFYAFILSLLAGVFFASDCISEEKREGTLGLLFLTDLRGVDVVLGKLVSCGLSSLYGLVAVLPVIALPILMGGTTGGQFWRTALALINNLFFAMAAGIFVSTISKQAHRAMLGTVTLILVIVLLLPAFGSMLSSRFYPAMLGFPYLFWYVSPTHAFWLGLTGSGAVAAQFWHSLLASNLFAWAMIGIASWLLPRVWQEKQFARFSWAQGASLGKKSLHRRMPVGVNPVGWIMGRNGNFGWAVWLIIAFHAAFTLLNWVLMPSLTGAFPRRPNPFSAFGLSSAESIPGFLLKLFFAVQACKFFAEARSTGELELIASTPLTSREIIQGQWLGLKRTFLWPVILFLLPQFILVLFSLFFRPAVSNNVSLPPGVANGMVFTYFFGIINWFMTHYLLGQLIASIYAAVRFVTNLTAIGWMGMWLGLTSRKPNLAPVMTFLFVVILPHLVCMLPGIVGDLIFIFWARSKLRENIRRHVFPEQWPYAGLQTLVPAPVKPPSTV